MITRLALFLMTNLAIILVLSVVTSLFGLNGYLTAHGIDYGALLVFAAIVGFTGSIFSLLISKWMAKRFMGVQLISPRASGVEARLREMTLRLAREAGIGEPEVGIYESAEINAFATGANRNNALVAVSTGLLATMNEAELEGVIGHEISHIANGDMVTMALLQGVLNTFVIFFARIAAYIVCQFFQGDEDEAPVSGSIVYYLVAFVFEVLFGILATIIAMWFSRYREYRADSGSAKLVGKEKMVKALECLDREFKPVARQEAKSIAAMKIAGISDLASLFSSHPPIAARISALNKNA